MSMSLRDQLIQAGLGTKKQVKETSKGQRPRSRHQPEQVSAEKLAASTGHARRRGGRQGLNSRQQEKAAARARRAQVKQLIEQYRLASRRFSLTVVDTNWGSLGRLAVTPQLRE